MPVSIFSLLSLSNRDFFSRHRRHSSTVGRPWRHPWWAAWEVSYVETKFDLRSGRRVGGQILTTACQVQLKEKKKVANASSSHQWNNTLVEYSHRGRPLADGGGREGVCACVRVYVGGRGVQEGGKGGGNAFGCWNNLTLAISALSEEIEGVHRLIEWEWRDE